MTFLIVCVPWTFISHAWSQILQSKERLLSYKRGLAAPEAFRFDSLADLGRHLWWRQTAKEGKKWLLNCSSKISMLYIGQDIEWDEKFCDGRSIFLHLKTKIHGSWIPTKVQKPLCKFPRIKYRFSGVVRRMHSIHIMKEILMCCNIDKTKKITCQQ